MNRHKAGYGALLSLPSVSLLSAPLLGMPLLSVLLLSGLPGCATTPAAESAPPPAQIEGVEPALPTPAPQPIVVAAPQDSAETGSTVIADDVADTAASACDASGDASLVQLRGDELVLPDKIHYLFGKARLHDRSHVLLDALASRLCQQPNLVIEIGVHTDSRGSSHFNRAISQKRADAVRDYLLDKGIPPRQLTAKGFGEDRPISHAPPQDLRRTEFKVLAP